MHDIAHPGENEMANETTQAIAQAMMLGGMQSTLQDVKNSSSEILAIVRAQQSEINKLRENDGRQDTRLDGHDREFGDLRNLLSTISDKLDSKGLTWPKLLTGGAALASVIGVSIAAIVAVSNGLSYLAEIVDKVG